MFINLIQPVECFYSRKIKLMFKISKENFQKALSFNTIIKRDGSLNFFN